MPAVFPLPPRDSSHLLSVLTVSTIITILTNIVSMVDEGGGMERIIDVTAARRQLGTLLDEVFYKKEIITIQRKGKSLAKIVPIEVDNPQNINSTTISLQQQSLLEEMEGLPIISRSANPTKILRSMREEKRLKANNIYGK